MPSHRPAPTAAPRPDAPPGTPPGGPARLPVSAVEIGAGLTVTEVLPALLGAVEAGAAAVVHAPPGTGKTTVVPPALAHWCSDGGRGRVLVTQPRRVAVRAAWSRLTGAVAPALPPGTLAEELVGYAVRGDSVGAGTALVEFLTPGVLLRRLLRDPELEGVGAVVLDEVHERDLDTDLLFALLADVRQLRPELAVLAMSATLDAEVLAERWSRGMGGSAVEVVRTASALHPLREEHAPYDGGRLRADGRVEPGFLAHVARTAVAAHAEALATDPGVDALVFVPGVAEVEAVARHVREQAPGTDVVLLHGRQEPAEQDAALAGRTGDRPRMVVSTGVAESSVTVPGVRLVVDSALAREPRRDATRGTWGLMTVQVSRSSAGQRAGRAARLGPGTVVRCCTRAALGAAAAQPIADLAVADLDGAALAFADWGVPRGEGLTLPEEPPAGRLAEAEARLRGLAAVDEAGRITAHGRRLAALPLDPPLGHALVRGAEQVGVRPAAEVVALLSLDDHLRDPDLGQALRSRRRGGQAAEPWRRQTRRLQDALRRTGGTPGGDGGQAPDGSPDGVGRVVAQAAPERIGRAVDEHTYLLASGTRAELPPGSTLAGAPWLAVARTQRVGDAVLIRAAAELDEAHALDVGAALVSEPVDTHWHEGRLRAVRRTVLGAIELETRRTAPTRETAEAAVVQRLGAQGIGPGGAPADALRRRIQFLHRVLGPPWPSVDDDALARDPDVVAAVAEQVAAGRAWERVDLAGLLRGLLPWPLPARLDELAPERVPIPSGRAVTVDYPALDEPQAPPVLAAKLQEFFGAASGPVLAGGRAPVLLHLLSPAGRPLAVTADLGAFFAGAYAQVRAEGRGRYPKHPWPEDPRTAEPTSRTTRRR